MCYLLEIESSGYEITLSKRPYVCIADFRPVERPYRGFAIALMWRELLLLFQTVIIKRPGLIWFCLKGREYILKPSLTHIALHVRNLEACIVFYQEYAELKILHDRMSHGKRIVWLAELGREKEFILVLLPGGPGRNQVEGDFSHLGFALASREAVDQLSDKARAEGILVWEPKDEPYPVGYYCGVKDPDGNFVEFSYGQPLGPGANEWA